MQPWQLVLISVAGWMSRKQQQVVDYLLKQNRVLREQIGKERLQKIARAATPQVLLKWYRDLIAGKYDGDRKRGPGRPKTGEEFRELVIRSAKENLSCDWRFSGGANVGQPGTRVRWRCGIGRVG